MSALIAIVGLLVVGIPFSTWLTVSNRRNEAAHRAQVERIEEADRIAKVAANIAGFGVLGKEANR